MTVDNADKQRKPPWLKVRAFTGEGYTRISTLLKELHLNTVCQEANCPNRGECYNQGTATFLILGKVCTRNCKFCDIATGKPAPPDPLEPFRVAQAAFRMKLKHVVITSVDRDDLPDGGAAHFAATIRQIRERLPDATVEILTPDFRGNEEAWQIVLDAQPDIFNHNVETVPRLYPEVRPAARYSQSLELLSWIRRNSSITTKSGLMVGLGETFEELREVFADLAASRVSILTIGQYLAPSPKHYPVARYLSPEEFVRLREVAEEAGIPIVFSAPLVRSSYHAREVFSQV